MWNDPLRLYEGTAIAKAMWESRSSIVAFIACPIFLVAFLLTVSRVLVTFIEVVLVAGGLAFSGRYFSRDQFLAARKWVLSLGVRLLLLQIICNLLVHMMAQSIGASSTSPAWQDATMLIAIPLMFGWLAERIPSRAQDVVVGHR